MVFKRGFWPNVVTYNTLFRGLRFKRKAVEVERLFEKIITLGEIQPNVVTYNIIINGVKKIGHMSMDF